MLDAFQLKEQLIGMTIRTTAVLTDVVAEDGFDSNLMLIKKRQDIFIEHMHDGDRQVGGIYPPQS